MASPSTHPLEDEARVIRSDAAVRLLRSDPELSPDEALLMVVAPSAAIRAASIARAEERVRAARERGCRRCHTDLEEDGACPMCGAANPDADRTLVAA
jgi:hypothetical protein